MGPSGLRICHISKTRQNMLRNLARAGALLEPEQLLAIPPGAAPPLASTAHAAAPSESETETLQQIVLK
jgi:hypothetical protein